MSIFSKCSNVSRATFLMALCEMLAKIAFLNSPKRVVKILASPSTPTSAHPSLSSYHNVHPAILAPARIHTVLPSVIGTFMASTISLKKNGTWTFNTFPATSRPSAPITRVLVRGEPRGQIFSASLRMMLQSVRAWDFSSVEEVIALGFSAGLLAALVLGVGSREGGGDAWAVNGGCGRRRVAEKERIGTQKAAIGDG